MSTRHHQLTIGPLEVQRVGTAERPAEKVGNAAAEKVGSVNLVTIARLAAKRVGYFDKELADVFGLSASDCSKAFDVDEPTRNRPMKAALPRDYAEAFCRELAKALGLRIGGSEEQQRALANLVHACGDMIAAAGER